MRLSCWFMRDRHQFIELKDLLEDECYSRVECLFLEEDWQGIVGHWSHNSNVASFCFTSEIEESKRLEKLREYIRGVYRDKRDNPLMSCILRRTDNRYFIYVGDKEFSHGDSELSAWKLAESNAEFMKRMAKDDAGISEANVYLHEIRDALQYLH